MLVLTVLQGPDKGRRFELPDDEPQLIGRSSEALVLNDRTISRRHAELTPDDGRWYINDLESSNGTFVNGVRVTARRMLQPGDQIRAGSTLFVYGEFTRTPTQRAVRLAGKDEISVEIEQTVAANDDSMIMAVPDPNQAAQFHLKVIYELTSVISTVTDQEALLERVMDVIFEYFQADRGFILTRQNPRDETEAPVPVVVRRRDPATNKPITEPPDGPVKLSKTIVQYVMSHAKGVLSSNAMTDTRFASGDSVQALAIRSALCVPIRYKDRLYGVIHLDSQIANFTYTEDQLTLLTALGVQTGMALSNMRLVAARLHAERLGAVGQTVASLSHSIKNILQGMRGGADVVEIGLRKQDLKLVKSGWDIVDRNLARIYGLTLNMLQFSKQRKPELEMTNMHVFLSELVQLVQPQFDSKNVAILLDVDETVPPVPIDAGGVHQALLNLLNNALDAVEPQSGVVSVGCHFDDRDDDERVRLTVTDNGAGMSGDTQRRLFQPFHSTKGYGGTGLGLVVTKKIVDEHGGLIGVESTPGVGTTFTLMLPIRADAIPASADTHGPGEGI